MAYVHNCMVVMCVLAIDVHVLLMCADWPNATTADEPSTAQHLYIISVTDSNLVCSATCACVTTGTQDCLCKIGRTRFGVGPSSARLEHYVTGVMSGQMPTAPQHNVVCMRAWVVRHGIQFGAGRRSRRCIGKL